MKGEQVKIKLTKNITEKELLGIKNRMMVVNCLGYHLTNHMKHRMKQREITPYLIKETLKKYKVIELKSDYRVLLRSEKAFYNNKYNLCMVVDLKSRNIVTAYLNNKNDNHETINSNRYTNDFIVNFN
jgi:hypothetical protein